MFEVNTFALMQFSRLMGAHMKEAGKGAHRQHRQHGGSRRNCQIQPLFGY